MLWSKWCWLAISDDRFLQVLGRYYRYCGCCLFAFFLFIISFCFAFYNQTSDIEFTVCFMAGNKSIPLRIYGSMSEVFLWQFLRNNIYFMSKKYAVRKNSEAIMKTIFTETVFNWPDQYVSCRQHPHKHLKWRPFQQLSMAFSN